MAIAFYVWGFLGLIINGMNFLTLTGDIGVGTSAYLMVGNLIWIGGMILFGVGALINASRSKEVTVGTISVEKKHWPFAKKSPPDVKSTDASTD